MDEESKKTTVNNSLVLESNPNNRLINHEELSNEIIFRQEQQNFLIQFQKKFLDLDIWTPDKHEVFIINR